MRKRKMWSLWLVFAFFLAFNLQVFCEAKAEAKVKEDQKLALEREARAQFEHSLALEKEVLLERKLEQERQQMLAEQEAERQAEAARQAAIAQEQARQAVQPVSNYTGLSIDVAVFLEQECNAKQVPVSILVGLIQKESTFNPNARNPSTGAAGLGQIEENTAASLASIAGVPYQYSSLFDPEYNLRLTITYVDYLHSKTGDWSATLTAYNRGIGGLQAYRQATGTSVSSYSRDVLQNAQRVQEATGVN